MSFFLMYQLLVLFFLAAPMRSMEHRMKNSFFFYLGIENLQGFCKKNQNFSAVLNPGDVSVNRESVSSIHMTFILLISWYIRFDCCNVCTKEVCTSSRKYTIN